MIVELGHFCLALALALSLALAGLPLAGASWQIQGMALTARPLAIALFLIVLISFFCLIYAFVSSDFSVQYVASHSNSRLPLLYRVSGVWGGHEGSLLLWVLMLTGWAAAVAVFSKRIPLKVVARVLGTLGLVSTGFLLFTLLTSNPFVRILPALAEGRDLNPLLQDPGLVFHPPMLYMGYVGFCVAFAFGIAALLGGRVDTAWVRWARPWTNLAWAFLTMGIALGSYWAYYELGWGGWWFWDPVENASFMPWLAGTALIHSMAASEKRGQFRAWTILLAIFAFSLSLLGTFLVRSGVITSVHAFATDPARGVFILALLAVVAGGSILLYAWRAPVLRSTGTFTAVSREVLILGNNLFMLVATLTVMLGTLYPLALDAAGVAKVSVGPPYFNAVFAPLMIPVLVMLGVANSVRWKRDRLSRIVRLLGFPLIGAMVGALLPLMFASSYQLAAGVGVALALWLSISVAVDFYHRVGKSGRGALARMRALPAGWWGMTIAHLGVAVFVVGVSCVSNYSVEKNIVLQPGKAEVVAGIKFEMLEVTPNQGPNYSGHKALFRLSRADQALVTLVAEKRIYLGQQSALTEAGIDGNLAVDYLVSLGEPLGNSSWSVLLQVKPFMRWVWFGALFMAIGAIVAACDARYRVARVVAKRINLTTETKLVSSPAI